MLTYAIIGTGRISVNHFAAVKVLSEHLNLSAVCDLVPGNIETALAKAEISAPAKKYTDYRELLEKEKPDLVAIATDSGSHAEIGIHCLNRGAHCIIEKPIALSIYDADSLINASEKNGRVLAVCHQNRFNKSMVKIRRALDDGRFGRLSHIAAHVRWNRGEDYYNQAKWRGKWASDGGCLMNQCIHNADLLHWFMGNIDEVFAYSKNVCHPYIEGEDLGIALVRGKNGVLGLFEGTVNVYPKNLEETLYLFGEKGTVKAAGTSVNMIEEWNFSDSLDDPEQVKKECKETPPNVYGFGHLPFYKDVLEAINKGQKPMIDGYEGKRALELILAIYKSKKTGAPVKLPLGNFASTDMMGTF